MHYFIALNNFNTYGIAEIKIKPDFNNHVEINRIIDVNPNWASVRKINPKKIVK
jgi:hypothetical protein